MQRIVFPDAPGWVQSVKLDGKTYKLRARWNVSANTWSLDVLTRGERLLVAGLRLVRGQALLRQFQNLELPPGDLFVYDTGARGDEYTDFTEGRAVLAYITADEVADLSGADA
ncbi:MAG: hypothetical protein Unbinned3138contig1000_33 [Prokaryotic dsDNA virus sp.]|nr:MAG: hypothetical protein Unbinned3138contig1000_33 [Prokaryotic dsDNA virus sp.]|tara:strand:- start:4218 stop:4556 length:339 start_codon:yes stop_codon:yes gene_type:complete